MKKTFDDIFNEFFGEALNTEAKNAEIRKVIQTIANFKRHNAGELSDEEVEMELGQPSTTEEYIEDGILYTKMVWKTSVGEYMKIVITDFKPKISIETLEEQLAEAVAVEDYSTAIAIRDEITKIKEKK